MFKYLKNYYFNLIDLEYFLFLLFLDDFKRSLSLSLYQSLYIRVDYFTIFKS